MPSSNAGLVQPVPAEDPSGGVGPPDRGIGAPNRGPSSRAVEVDRRWRRAVWWVHGRIFWRWWGIAEASFLAGSYLTFLILFAEPALWPAGWRPPWVAHPLVLEIGPRSSLFLLPLVPLAGAVVDGALALQQPPGLVPRRGLRVLRFACASLPLLNLYVFPLWRLLVQRRPPWAFMPEPPRHPLSPGAAVQPSAGWWLRVRSLHRLMGSGWLLAWLAVSFLVPLWWTICLTAALEAQGRRILLTSFVAGLHLAAALAVFLSLRPQLPTLSRGSALAARVVPWLWLLPVPACLFGLVGLELAKLSPQGSSLIGEIYGWRDQLGQRADWRAVQTAVHRRWRGLPFWRRWFDRAGEQRTPVAAKADRQLQAFYRLKTLLLVLDVAAAVVVVAVFGQHLPAVRAAYAGLILGALILSVALLGIGLLVQALALVARLARAWELQQRLDRRPWGRYLLLTQLAVLAGLGLGHWLVYEQAQLLLLLCLGTVLVTLLAVLLGMALSLGGPPRDTDPLDLLWALAFLAMALAGALAPLDENIHSGLRRLLLFAVWTVPVWHLALVGAVGGWLLRPYRWRDLFSSRLSRATYLGLTGLALVAVLPLGGWVIPLVIAKRGHRRTERSGGVG